MGTIGSGRRGQSLRLGTGLLAAGPALLWACSLSAQEPPPPPPPPAEEAEGQPWSFQPDERFRDPFTYGKRKVPAAGVTITQDEAERLRRKTLELISEAGNRYGEAERAVKQYHFRQAVGLCDLGLQALQQIKSDSVSQEMVDLQDRLDRLKVAADRLARRTDAENTLERMAIRVTGLLAREKRPLAIINGKTVSKGDRLDLGGNEEDAVRIVSILRDRIIVSFRGYQMAIPVMEAAAGSR